MNEFSHDHEHSHSLLPSDCCGLNSSNSSNCGGEDVLDGHDHIHGHSLAESPCCDNDECTASTCGSNCCEESLHSHSFHHQQINLNHDHAHVHAHHQSSVLTALPLIPSSSSVSQSTHVNSATLSICEELQTLAAGSGDVCSSCDPNNPNSIPHAIQITRFKIANLCCSGEERIILSSLNGRVGIEMVSVNVIGRYCVVKHCPVACCAPVSQIVEILNDKKLGASVAERTDSDDGAESTSIDKVYLSYILLIWALFFLGVALINHYRSSSNALLIVSTSLGALPIIHDAYISVFIRWTIDIHILMVVAIAGALVVKEYIDSALVVSLFLSAEMIEGVVMSWVRQAVNSSCASAPKKATLKGGSTVSIDDLKLGDVVCLRAGDLVPCDAVVVMGAGVVDESALTGESLPLLKKKPDQVFSGTMMQNGYVEVQVNKEMKDCTMRQLSQAVADVQADKGEFAKIVDKFSLYWTPIILVATFLIIVVGGGVSNKWDDFVMKGITLLVLACPCSIVIAAPIPSVCAIATAAKNGVLIRGSSVIERMGLVSTAALDKTGTITKGLFCVVDRATVQNLQMDCNPLELAAAIESKSSHPLANAIVSAFCGCIAEMEGDLPQTRKIKVIDGVGVEGWVDVGSDFRHVIVGNEKVFKLNGGKVPLSQSQQEWVQRFVSSHNSHIVVFICVDDELQMMLALADEVRGDSEATLASLKAIGIDLYMLTGDCEGVAMQVCDIVKIPRANCHFRLLPRDKLSWIQSHTIAHSSNKSAHTVSEAANEVSISVSADEEEGEGLVNDNITISLTCNEVITSASAADVKKTYTVMVGDGINDAAALAASTCGVAMGVGGSALASAAADIVLMTDSISSLPATISLCRQARAKIVQNVMFSIAFKIVGVILTIMGILHLWHAVLIDMGALFFVIANGTLPLFSSAFTHSPHSQSQNKTVDKVKMADEGVEAADGISIEVIGSSNV